MVLNFLVYHVVIDNGYVCDADIIITKGLVLVHKNSGGGCCGGCKVQSFF